MITTTPRDFRAAALMALVLAVCAPAGAQTDLSDEPLLALKAVAGNVALALSVEFPTAVSVAHVGDTYVEATTYIGYFDPAKCYNYVFNANEALRHFAPAGLTTNHQCASPKWSGNFLNWATMQTIDPFRWVLTGGFRVVDTPTETILEKATASGQGGTANFPNRTLTAGIATATGTSLSTFKMRIQGLGNRLRFTQNGSVDSEGTPFDPAVPIDVNKVYEVNVRVKVCDTSAGSGGVEVFNCVQYANGNFKPEGLIQRFADKLRLSAFGYLNDPDLARDGGVLRARQKFVGPTQPVPGKADVANAAKEWDETTGVFVINPDATDAASTSGTFSTNISNSGVINYLNKFGQLGVSDSLAETYKSNDPVSEMYYAAVRYFKKQGNVDEWTNPNGKSGRALADGFPVITTYDDPIQFSCQKNFILGIGDVNTHADRNVPGASGRSEPTQPQAVSGDGTINAVTATNKLAVLEGLSATLGLTSPYNGCCDNNGALIAGLAYDVHTRDIRTDFADKQTISTFWMDVLEFQRYKDDNQYYLAAKYGGFTVPNGYNPDTNTTPLPNELWHTNGQTLGKNLVPDNYFVAANPDQVVGGLTKAFTAIASQITAFGTAFSVVQPQVAAAGTATYSANFDWGLRQGEVTASEVTFNATGVPTVLTPPRWQFSQKLRQQLASDGAFSSNRRVVTFDPLTGKGVPFRIDTINAQQRKALDTPFALGDDAANFLNYLRGDQANEQGRSDDPSRIRVYRTRQTLVGDIVGSKVVPVQAPSAAYADFSNPGYNAFKQANKARPVVVYFGGNDGMLHALRGDLGTGGGEELFAFVPNALFRGPDNKPEKNGLAALGDPAFAAQGEYFFVNATPRVFDVDFNRTPGALGTTPDWHSVLIGGLGKGGRSYYAIDVTDPVAMTTEGTAAAKVLWEFTDPDLGFTFGDPIVAKTAKYGWVVVLTSGHNNADGRGYFFFVNPRNGALLEKISTGAGTAAKPAGMTQSTALVLNRTDGTIDAVYAGDLLGNLWRVDVTAASGSYVATQLAVLTDANGVNGAVQPVTTRPLIVIQPGSNKRFVTVGTGRLLGDSDQAAPQVQAYYAFADGTASRFNKSGDLPTNVTFPLTRANFAENTDLVAGVNLAANQLGWVLTLNEKGTDGTASRVIADSAPFFGRVTFASTLPNNVPCQAAGTSRVFSVDVASGRSVLLDDNGARIASVPLNGVVTDLAALSVSNSAGGTGVLSTVVGDSSGTARKLNVEDIGARPLKRINWRELPTVQ